MVYGAISLKISSEIYRTDSSSMVPKSVKSVTLCKGILSAQLEAFYLLQSLSTFYFEILDSGTIGTFLSESKSLKLHLHRVVSLREAFDYVINCLINKNKCSF